MSACVAPRLLLGCCWLLATLALRVSALDTWIGSAPFCKTNPSDCHRFDLQYVRSDPTGDGSDCSSGNKVLCRTKPLSANLVETPLNDLVVVVYNIWERPFSVSHDGQTERTCHLPRALLTKFPETDVIVFNEVSIGGCMQSDQASKLVTLTELLDSYGFTHCTNIVGESSRAFYNVNGGAVIVSRWPIVHIKEMLYSDYSGMDLFSEKGAVYAKVSKQGVMYHIVATHLQNGDYPETRIKQAKQLGKFIGELDLPRTEPVIIAGDFNCDRLGSPDHTASVLESMQAKLPPVIGDVRFTYDYASNDLIDSSHTVKEWLDYAVLSIEHRQPDTASIESYQLRADTGIHFCSSAIMQPYYVSPVSIMCHKDKVTKELSSHYPVIGRFTFNNS